MGPVQIEGGPDYLVYRSLGVELRDDQANTGPINLDAESLSEMMEG